MGRDAVEAPFPAFEGSGGGFGVDFEMVLKPFAVRFAACARASSRSWQELIRRRRGQTT